MNDFIFDTDILTLYRQGNAAFVNRARTIPDQFLVTTVITVEEQVSGWNTAIRQAKTPAQIEQAYGRLTGTIELFTGLRILTFPQQAIARYQQLKALKLNVGTMDLRIAAIAFHFGGTVVTQIVPDFCRVQGLAVADWTRP